MAIVKTILALINLVFAIVAFKVTLNCPKNETLANGSIFAVFLANAMIVWR